MSNPKIVFADTETTGLHVELGHVIWEIGAIQAYIDREKWQLVINDILNVDVILSSDQVVMGDPMALKISGYYRRRSHSGELYSGQGEVEDPDAAISQGRNVIQQIHTEDIAWAMAKMLADAHLVGAVPSFDERFFNELLNRGGQVSTHHYHILDIEPLMAGHLMTRKWESGVESVTIDGKKVDILDLCSPPYRSRDLSLGCGIDKPEGASHTALGDAQWALDVFAAIYGLEVVGLPDISDEE